MTLKSLIKSVFALMAFCSFRISAQEKVIDSLKNCLEKATHDTMRCFILSKLVETESDDKKWPIYNEQLRSICETNLKKLSQNNPLTLVYKRYYSSGLSDFGYLLDEKGNSSEALKKYIAARQIQKEINDKKGIVTSYNNIGFTLLNKGDISGAIENFSKSLSISEAQKDEAGIAQSLNNLGYVYSQLGDSEKSLDYYFKSAVIREKIGAKKGYAICLNNIGAVYDEMNQPEKALEYLNKSLVVQRELKDYESLSATLINIGGIHLKKGDYPSSLYCYKKALNYQDSISDHQGIVTSLNNIGFVYYKMKKYELARSYCMRSLNKAQKLQFPYEIQNSAKRLSQIFKSQNNFKASLEYYELFIKMRDSINNIETQKASIKQQEKYTYQQKEAVTKAKHDTELKQQQEKAIAERNKQYVIIGSVSTVLLIVAIFSFVLFNRFKVIQKQKLLIEVKEKETYEQKLIIEEKHKEITDSINYAERIQKSFLATNELLNSYLKNYFLIFKPKDIVSGDFYWASQLKNGNFAFATADSTGHGVPGAIMSLLNITSLEKAIEHLVNPSEILNHTRQIIIDRLKKDGSPDGGKDGMDCSLIVFDFENKQLLATAANNPIWIIRDKQLVEIKPDKMPVGKNDKEKESFTLHTIALQENDLIYTLTDGFPDQFGGPKGKKFMSKNLKEVILANSHLTMEEQKILLESTLTEWIGKLDQVDDITLVGIKI